MKKYFVVLVSILLLASCHSSTPKMQYQAEKEFTSSLKQKQKDALLELGDNFMTLLKNGGIEPAVNQIFVIYNDQLYKKSESYTAELVQRFTRLKVYDFSLDSCEFSTQANNDLCYRVEITPKDENGDAVAIRLTLNPVLIDGQWYLTLKDGNQSSKAMSESDQIHPKSKAPAEVKLHTKENQK